MPHTSTLKAALLGGLILLAAPFAEARSQSAVVAELGLSTGTHVFSSDGELVGILRSGPRVIDADIRFFVKKGRGSTFRRYSEDVIIDVPLHDIQIQNGAVILPAREIDIFNGAYIPPKDHGAAIRVNL